jgi:putative transposase
MTTRLLNFVPGEFYHIYNRGNSKQKIFHDRADYHRFLKLLYTANSDKNLTIRNFTKEVYNIKRGKPLVAIGVYCLMPNHFHILVTQTENGDISKFMLKLTTAYSMYYNNKHKRTGSLFEGRFKSEYVVDDRYLKYLFSYIHLNPLKLISPHWKEEHGDRGKFKNFLKTYKFSSYLDYLGTDRPDKIVINPEKFPNYFPTPALFESEISDWINLDSA